MSVVKNSAPVPKGLPGRLTKGAGTHLASWLQQCSAISAEEAQELLDNSNSAGEGGRGAISLDGLIQAHGDRAGHSRPFTDVAYSGDILITKDPASMRLWRARGDYALLRVVSCPGSDVTFHPSGQFIVTGFRGGNKKRLKIWGPAGASAFSAGRKSIVHR